MERYSIGAVLPHLRVFGGIRRYLSLGSVWHSWGHDVALYTPEGAPSEWLPFPGRIRPFAALSTGSHDVAFTPQPTLLPELRALIATRRIWYCAAENEPGEALAIRDRNLGLAAVSTALAKRLARRARRPVLDGTGAVDVDFFRPERGLRDPGRRIVTAYGRRSRPRKGTDLVMSAARLVAMRYPDLELVLFDHVGPGNEQDPRDGLPTGVNTRFVLNPSADELAKLYAETNLFVAAEKRAGWCNTAAEAMASGACVVCTPSGTGDFARNGKTALVVPVRHPWFLAAAMARALGDEPLRTRLGAAGRTEMERHDWSRLAAKLLIQIGLGAGVPAGLA